MALFLFTKAILAGEPIDVFNHGNMSRDFTYIDDIVEGVIRVVDRTAEPHADFNPNVPDPAVSNVPYRVFNIGNNQPVKLMEYIEAVEAAVGVTATKNLMPMQTGDVANTFADTRELDAWVGFKPNTPVRDGVARFVAWYRQYYGV
jgi:UDP-glucuronate 4-epimerase